MIKESFKKIFFLCFRSLFTRVVVTKWKHKKSDLTNLKENYAEIRKFISDFFGKLKIMCNFAQCKI